MADRYSTGNHSARQILIGDDAPSIRLLCVTSLTKAGYRVLQAEGSSEAIITRSWKMTCAFGTSLKTPTPKHISSKSGVFLPGSGPSVTLSPHRYGTYTHSRQPSASAQTDLSRRNRNRDRQASGSPRCDQRFQPRRIPLSRRRQEQSRIAAPGMRQARIRGTFSRISGLSQL